MRHFARAFWTSTSAPASHVDKSDFAPGTGRKTSVHSMGGSVRKQTNGENRPHTTVSAGRIAHLGSLERQQSRVHGNSAMLVSRRLVARLWTYDDLGRQKEKQSHK
jgi:hypothetical protein